MSTQYNYKDVSAGDVVSFSLADVPEYLRQTEFFTSLANGDEEITLPKQYFKTSLSVNSPSDAHDLLSTMRFWGVEKIPSELIMYVVKSSHQDLSDLLSSFTQELKIVEFLHLLNLKLYHIRPSTYDKYIDKNELRQKNSTLESVVSLLVLQFKHECGQLWNGKTCALAASLGWFDCLQFLHEMGCPWDASTCTTAAESNHLKCLKYAYAHGCPLDEQIKSQALKSRKNKCYMYIREQACLQDKPKRAAATAAKSANIALLKSMHEGGSPWGKQTCAKAALVGALDCLQYAHEQGCPWDERTCSNAAKHGHLECLAFAHEQGCPWDAKTCYNAAGNGHLACLMYAHQQGCPWDTSTSVAAVCVWNKSSACLAYAHQNGCPWNEEVVKRAALFGHRKCLRYALNNNCSGREIACENVFIGDVKCLKYLREEQNCPWGPRIVDKFARASYSSSTKCLQYCLEQGCLADADTMLLAATSVSRMKVLREHGCPWESTLVLAIYAACNTALKMAARVTKMSRWQPHHSCLSCSTCTRSSFNSAPCCRRRINALSQQKFQLTVCAFSLKLVAAPGPKMPAPGLCSTDAWTA